MSAINLKNVSTVLQNLNEFNQILVKICLHLKIDKKIVDIEENLSEVNSKLQNMLLLFQLDMFLERDRVGMAY